MQPLQASVKGKLADLTTNWNWNARISAAAFNLKPWSPESGIGNFALELDTTGDRDSLRASGRVAPDKLPTGPMTVAFDGAYVDRALRTDRLQIVLTNGTQVAATGSIGFPGGMPLLDLRGLSERGIDVVEAILGREHEAGGELVAAPGVREDRHAREETPRAQRREEALLPAAALRGGFDLGDLLRDARRDVLPRALAGRGHGRAQHGLLRVVAHAQASIQSAMRAMWSA